MDVVTRSEAETEAVASALARELAPGSTVLLYGELGAGKTAFVRGLAAGLGLAPADVTSPTFTLVQEYRGPVTLQHVDLYRLEPAEVVDLALEDLSDSRSIVAIEWADRLPAPPGGAVEVRLDHVAGGRRIRVTGPTPGASRPDAAPSAP